MIVNLIAGPGVTIAGNINSLPYVSVSNSNNPIIGMMRLNSGQIEVFDGTGWLSMPSSHPTVSLDPDTQDLLQWARAQRAMAMNRLTLAQNNPALMNALENLKRAEDNFELLSEFVKHDKRETA
jgi:hypothetical protein